MLTAEQLNRRVMDVPNLHPVDEGPQGQRTPRYKRSEYVASNVLCAQAASHPSGFFAASQISDGRYMAVWQGHADLFDSLDEMTANLNSHERSLLEFGVNNV